MISRSLLLPAAVLLSVVTFTSDAQRLRPRSNLVCMNGKIVNGSCQCDTEYAGKHCEKKKMCDSYRRYRNGTCLKCMDGYNGTYCEDIDCGKHGELDSFGLSCKCEKPYSGTHCTELERADVYNFYNNRVNDVGPIGALSIIPMILILIGCERMAKKRHVNRLEKQMAGVQNVSIHKNALKNLLAEDV